MTAFTDFDGYLFRQGTHRRLYENLGAHPDGTGWRFAVWAPNARQVAVVGDFNGWNGTTHRLHSRSDDTGVWEGRVEGAQAGQRYKFRIVDGSGRHVDKADPFAFATELPPRTASVLAHVDYRWRDDDWMARRAARQAKAAPMTIYEVHLGSWRRDPADPTRQLSYGEIAPALAAYAGDMGFTHVEPCP